MAHLKFPLPCKIRCIKDFPQIARPTFHAGETLQVRSTTDDFVNVDKTGGGIFPVPNESFNDDNFMIVVQVLCTTDYKANSGDDQPLFGKNGSYWAALHDDGSYWVFFSKSPNYSSFGANEFAKHFKLIS